MGACTDFSVSIWVCIWEFSVLANIRGYTSRYVQVQCSLIPFGALLNRESQRAICMSRKQLPVMRTSYVKHLKRGSMKSFVFEIVKQFANPKLFLDLRSGAACKTLNANKSSRSGRENYSNFSFFQFLSCWIYSSSTKYDAS